MRRLAAILCILMSVAAAGCMSLEQTITLQKDLSGTAVFTMDIDMDPMVAMVARMTHKLTGKEGEPTAADIEAARTQLLTAKKSKPFEFEKEKAEIFEKLPAGVKLTDATFKDDGLKMGLRFALAFDNAAKLGTVKLEPPSGGTPAPEGVGNPMETPFLGLQVVDEGGTVLVTSPAQNPLAGERLKTEELAELGPEVMSEVEALLKKFSVRFKLAAPFDVIEHNAHRKEGTTLIWEYDMAAIEKMAKGDASPSIRVRYRK